MNYFVLPLYNFIQLEKDIGKNKILAILSDFSCLLNMILINKNIFSNLIKYHLLS